MNGNDRNAEFFNRVLRRREAQLSHLAVGDHASALEVGQEILGSLRELGRDEDFPLVVQFHAVLTDTVIAAYGVGDGEEATRLLFEFGESAHRLQGAAESLRSIGITRCIHGRATLDPDGECGSLCP